MKEVNGRKIKFPKIVTAERVAIKDMKDAKRGKDVSVCTLYVKWLHMLAKFYPQKVVKNTWIHYIKKMIWFDMTTA